MSPLEKLPVIYFPAGTVLLQPQAPWQNRHEIRSGNSDKLYVVAQHAGRRHWGCSCRGYTTRRDCRHLRELGIPSGETPYEAEPRIIAATSYAVDKLNQAQARLRAALEATQPRQQETNQGARRAEPPAQPSPSRKRIIVEEDDV